MDNPIIVDALKYYEERQRMNNPKGWDHVARKVLQGIEAHIWDASPEDYAEAKEIFG